MKGFQTITRNSRPLRGDERTAIAAAIREYLSNNSHGVAIFIHDLDNLNASTKPGEQLQLTMRLGQTPFKVEIASNDPNKIPPITGRILSGPHEGKGFSCNWNTDVIQIHDLQPS